MTDTQPISTTVTEPVTRHEVNVQKSMLDNCDYRFLTLSNQVEVLLVKDPDAKKSACCMRVGVGSLGDTVYKIDGLAHFCEHLCFLGSESYPKDGEFNDFLAKHGGSDNAYTSLEETVYFFSVSPDGFTGAVDRFAQFFISPTFNPDCVDRELQAVDSEHSKNIPSDLRREWRLFKINASPDSPLTKFSTGNSQTLRDDPAKANINVPELVKDFHSKFYSSNQMTLVIVHSGSFEEMEQVLIPRFSSIPNRGTEIPEIPWKEPFPTNEFPVILKTKPIKEKRTLQLFWKAPLPNEKWEKGFPYLISSILGDEGQGSIFNLLKEMNLASGLTTSVYSITDRVGLFKLIISLTQKGFSEYSKIIATVFEYLSILMQHLNSFPDGLVDPDIARLYHENGQLYDFLFTFKEKVHSISLARYLAPRVRKFPRENIWTAKRLVLDKSFQIADQEYIRDFVTHFSPRETRIVFSAPEFDFANEESLNVHSDGFYDMKFTRESLLGEQYQTEMQLWESVYTGTKTIFDSDLFSGLDSDFISSLKLSLSPPNPFIPDNFDLVNEPKTVELSDSISPDTVNPCIKIPEIELDRPELLSHDDSKRYSLWICPDTHFKVPKAAVNISFTLPLTLHSPLFRIQKGLWVYMMRDILNAFTYPAKVAGLSVSISSTSDGVSLKCSGYSQKLLDFALTILNTIISSTFTQKRLDFAKEIIKRSYANEDMKPAYSQAVNLSNIALTSYSLHFSELAPYIDGITLEQIQSFSKYTLFSEVITVLFIAGNVTKAQASDFSNTVKHLLFVGDDEHPPQPRTIPPFRPALFGQTYTSRVTQLSDKYITALTFPNTNPSDDNSALLALVQVPPIRNSAIDIPAKTKLDPYPDSNIQDYHALLYMHLIHTIFRDKTFYQLRTREQYGYIVAMQFSHTRGSGHLAFVIQSNTQSAHSLDYRIQSFFNELLYEFNKLTDAEFEQFKQGLITKCKEQPKSFQSYFNTCWHLISSDWFVFDYRERAVAFLESMTKNEVMEFFFLILVREPRIISIRITNDNNSKNHTLTRDAGDEPFGPADFESESASESSPESEPVGASTVSDSGSKTKKADDDETGLPKSTSTQKFFLPQETSDPKPVNEILHPNEVLKPLSVMPYLPVRHLTSIPEVHQFKRSRPFYSIDRSPAAKWHQSNQFFSEIVVTDVQPKSKSTEEE